MVNLYEFEDYRSYISQQLQSLYPGRGGKIKLATAIGCNSAYLSQVLKGRASLSMEQSEAISRFFSHDETAAQYFLYLVQWERAGTKPLKQFWKKRLNEVLQKKSVLAERLQFDQSMAAGEESEYYDHWSTAAVHMCTGISGKNSPAAIAEHLGLSLGVVIQALQMLIRMDLVLEKNAGFFRRTNSVHLPADSRVTHQNHINWRLRSISILGEQPQATTNLHYSSVVSMSRDDAFKVREVLTQAIEQTRKVVRSSGDEEIFHYSMDLFPLSRR